MATPERSPYEVLGLRPTATTAEVHAAFKRSLTAVRDRAERQACANAYGELRDADRRIGGDLSEYAVPDAEDTAREAFAGVDEEPFLGRDVPPAPPPAVLAVLRSADSDMDRREPPPAHGTFVIPRRYAGSPDVLPPVDVPR